jgi:hypothetical protein
MSKDALAKVVQRAISDAAFRRQLNSDPTGALRGFDLSSDELSALRTGDAGRLSTLGIDQRMSKAFAIGGAIASTRMSQSDVSSSGPSLVDDVSGVGGRTVIPSDPASGVRTGDDWKFTDRVASDAGASVRTGDDWKFADRAATQGAVAPVDGSPEASAADIAGGTRASAIHDDPNGFLAANASARGSVAPVEGSPEASASDIAGATRVSAINDDPDGFLAANADASGSVTRANVIHDDPNGFLAANANADATGNVSRGDGTAFLDESEAYLTKVGYDSSQRQTEVTDAHDRTYSGDDIAGPSSDSTSAGEGTAADHGDSSLTP